MPAIYIVLFSMAVLPILLAAVSIYFRATQLEKFDHSCPRAQQDILTGAGARLVAAQSNSWEALLMFTAVTVVATGSPIALESLNTAAYIFLVARLAYPAIYLANKPVLRSIVFGIGCLACGYIFLIALLSY